MDYVKLALEVLSELSKVFLDISQSIKTAEVSLRAKVEAMQASLPPDKDKT